MRETRSRFRIAPRMRFIITIVYFFFSQWRKPVGMRDLVTRAARLVCLGFYAQISRFMCHVDDAKLQAHQIAALIVSILIFQPLEHWSQLRAHLFFSSSSISTHLRTFVNSNVRGAFFFFDFHLFPHFCTSFNAVSWRRRMHISTSYRVIFRVITHARLIILLSGTIIIEVI